MTREPTLQQATIEYILAVCSNVKDLESDIYGLLKNVSASDGNKQVIRRHNEYNLGLQKIINVTKNDLGKAVLPTVIQKTIELGGPSFVQLDPLAISKSLQWTKDELFNFLKLRNETILLWQGINENIKYATVEEMYSEISGSVIE